MTVDNPQAVIVEGGWEVTHAEERKYVVSNRLNYDATEVIISALSRTTGKPDARGTSTTELHVGKYDVVEAGTGLLIDLAPTWQNAPLPFRLKIGWFDVYGERFHASPQVPSPDRPKREPRSDLRPQIRPGFTGVSAQLAAATRAAKASKGVTPSAAKPYG